MDCSDATAAACTLRIGHHASHVTLRRRRRHANMSQTPEKKSTKSIPPRQKHARARIVLHLVLQAASVAMITP